MFDLAVMVLSESFVKKMTAPINSPLFGLVSALFMSFYSVEVIAALPKELINPPPRVVSLCVRIVPKASAPQKDRAGFIMQRVFLYDNKKLKNILLETLWDYGHELAGRKLTKKDADSFIEEIFGKDFKQLLGKRVADFSNDDFNNIVSSLLQWSSRLQV